MRWYRSDRIIKRNLASIGLVELKHWPDNHVRRIRKFLRRECDTVELFRDCGDAGVDLKVVDDYPLIRVEGIVEKI